MHVLLWKHALHVARGYAAALLTAAAVWQGPWHLCDHALNIYVSAAATAAVAAAAAAVACESFWSQVWLDMNEVS
jgi:hypothetical protein